MIQSTKEYILQLLKTIGSRYIAGSLSGVWGWLAGIAFPMLFERLIKPPIQWLFRKLELPYQRWKARKAMKKVQDAKTDEEFDEALRDLP